MTSMDRLRPTIASDLGDMMVQIRTLEAEIADLRRELSVKDTEISQLKLKITPQHE